MFKKKDVLFYVEHINRELESVKKIAEHLEGKNYKIVSTAFAMGISKLIYRPKLIVVPWSYIDKDVQRLGSFPLDTPTIINLHHEQIGNNNTQEYFVPKGIAKDIYHISWGSNYSRLLKANLIRSEYIREVGSVRMELSRETKYEKENLAKTLKKAININKKWILFISSFSWKNLDLDMKSNFKKRGLKHVDDFEKVSKSSYLKTLKYIEYLLEKNNEIEYIYRLHPSEEVDIKLKDLETRFSNFHISKDLEVKEWIRNCDLVDLWISTSLNEIVALNKKFRIIRPDFLSENLDINYFKHLEKITSKEDFLKLDFSVESNLKISRKELKHYYRFDTIPSLEISNLIKELLIEDKLRLVLKNKIRIMLKEISKDILKLILYYQPFKISRMEKMKSDFFLFK